MCKTIYRSVTKIPWAVSLKKTQFIFPSSKWLFRVPPLVVGHHKTIPASWYNVDWLDLRQVLCRPTKLLWVPECRTPAILRRCYFCSHPPWSLALTTPLPRSKRVPEIWVGGDIDVPLVSVHLISGTCFLPLDQLWVYVLTIINYTKNPFWWGLRDVLIGYEGYRDMDLESV